MAGPCSRSPRLLTHRTHHLNSSVDRSSEFSHAGSSRGLASSADDFMDGNELYGLPVFSLSSNDHSCHPRWSLRRLVLTLQSHSVPSSHWCPARTATILRHTHYLQSSQHLRSLSLTVRVHFSRRGVGVLCVVEAWTHRTSGS